MGGTSPQQSAIVHNRANEARRPLPSRVTGETVRRIRARLLNALDPAGLLPIEGKKDDRLTSEFDMQHRRLKPPAFVARLILRRLSESEIRKLEILSGTDLLTVLTCSGTDLTPSLRARAGTNNGKAHEVAYC